MTAIETLAQIVLFALQTIAALIGGLLALGLLVGVLNVIDHVLHSIGDGIIHTGASIWRFARAQYLRLNPGRAPAPSKPLN